MKQKKEEKQEITITQELLFLEYLLFSLKNFKFDKDIEQKLKELYFLVSNKIYSKEKYPDRDCSNIEYKIVFYYEN